MAPDSAIAGWTAAGRSGPAAVTSERTTGEGSLAVPVRLMLGPVDQPKSFVFWARNSSGVRTPASRSCANLASSSATENPD